MTANNKGSESASDQLNGYIEYLLTEATTQFFQEEVEFEDIIVGGQMISGKLEGSNYT